MIPRPNARTGLIPPFLRERTGLTLIELTLVTLLLLVIIGLSIPTFKKTFQNLSAKDTTFNISKLINYAQEMAILENKNFKIIFDFEKGRYQLFEVDDSVNPPVYKKARSRFGKPYNVPEGLAIRGEKKDMVFYPDGHCDSIKIYILFKDKGYSLIVQRFGSAVSVKEVSIE